MKIYLVLTPDEFELIKDFDTNPKALAKRLGISLNYFYNKLSSKHKGVKCGYKLERIKIDESED